MTNYSKRGSWRLSEWRCNSPQRPDGAPDSPSPVPLLARAAIAAMRALHFWTGKWVGFLPEAERSKLSTYDHDAHT